MSQMQIKLQQAQCSRNISENMNKALQVSEPVLLHPKLSDVDYSFAVTPHFSIGRDERVERTDHPV